ncbi:fasciclin domain-containing protein [Rivibacter subsaxonicus]|uniref:Putative surface protein with fasciclin (FAS1) repeats n=1 Tax=Rivibacter subsaxonicus TaxID=457575 RepID=A0A4Q7VVP4_9BURK|nr:fasciclin domain-containing protein [Rivibacter subsaxonicus]RZU00752.1 putative surface protein with fasciclin (FAS1) repeats [Rivibacter subsaxonicus]
MTRWMKWFAALGAAALLAGCSFGDDDEVAPPVPVGNLAEVARANGFNALLAAVAKAELGSVLAGSDKLTVFAPTDAAFGALATRLGLADANALVAALSKDQLTKILSYHVVAGEVKKAQVPLATDITTLETGKFQVRASGADLLIADELLRDSRITATDVAASNGVIHVVDSVLLPEGVLNIVQTAQANPVFSKLVAAVVAADLAGALSGAGPLTVFAPVDTAFDAIASVVPTLSKEQLTTVLTYHVVGAKVLAADIPFGTPVGTLAGQNITISAGTPPTIADTTAAAARIVATDIEASNGVVHVIDKVLIPTL